ncbi:MAG: transcriptional regulator [Candidatus Thermoplasmatota archaeon]|nr:transcriptional regulator [Candidatus Thermoplasmatota archaeon]
MVHEPARYMILSILYVIESGDFLFIQTQTALTKGNLSSHISKLEEAGYVKVVKRFIGKRPHTMIRMTQIGKRAFEDYRRTMSRIIGFM